jgi:uncharacterized protein
MINNQINQKIKTEAQKYFIGASGCHDWSHVERVHDLAVRIAKKEKANLNIVRLASYLHDIGRKKEMDCKGKNCHAEIGAILAKDILDKYKVEPAAVNNICHCILAHRYRNIHEPKTIEARIIFDADKLDSIGAIGTARAFLFAGSAGSNCLYTGREKELMKNPKDMSYTKEDSALYEYFFKLKNVKAKILTKTGKKIAQERHAFMIVFFQRFEKEIKGLL